MEHHRRNFKGIVVIYIISTLFMFYWLAWDIRNRVDVQVLEAKANILAISTTCMLLLIVESYFLGWGKPKIY
jgi:hypothetical protein